MAEPSIGTRFKVKDREWWGELFRSIVGGAAEVREDLTGANSWGELFRSIVGGALLLVGILCMCLGSFILVIAYGPDSSLSIDLDDALQVRPSPPQTQEGTIAVVPGNAEMYGLADESNQIELLELTGAAAFLLGLGAFSSLTSMWIKWIGRTRKLETIVKQIAKSLTR